jgi:hypothetical protein
MTEKIIKRYIRGYSISGEKLIVELPLESAPLEVLQECFCESKDNPMYDSYKIEEEQAKILQKYASVPIELDKFDYYLECESVD